MLSIVSHLDVRRGDEGEPISFPFFLELLLRFLRRLYVILEASAFYALSQSAKASTVPSVYASSPISSSTYAKTVVCVASSYGPIGIVSSTIISSSKSLFPKR